jgi:hypothetical protein
MANCDRPWKCRSLLKKTWGSKLFYSLNGICYLNVLYCRKFFKSALEKPDEVSDKLCKELQANRIAGLFLDRPCKNVNVSPLGLCPKKEKGKFQLKKNEKPFEKLSSKYSVSTTS